MERSRRRELKDIRDYSRLPSCRRLYRADADRQAQAADAVAGLAPFVQSAGSDESKDIICGCAAQASGNPYLNGQVP